MSTKRVRKLLQNWRQTTIANRMLAGSTVLLTLATAGLVIVSVLQYLTIKEQTSAIKDQLGTMRDQTKTMQGQLDTFNDQAKSMREQSGTLKDSLDETRKAVKASQTQAEASLVQAKTSQVSARAAETSARAAQRSAQLSSESTRGYVSIDAMGLAPFEAGKPVTYYVVWSNDGNSPTEITSTRMGGGILPALPQSCNVGGTGTSAASVVVSPKGKRTQRYTADRGLTPAEIADIENGRQFYVVCGETLYTTLGQSYPFNFCSYYFPELKAFFDCRRGEH